MKRMADRAVFIVVGAAMALTAAVLVLPLVYTIAMSFEPRPTIGPFPPETLSLQWYRKFFESPYFLGGLWTSLLVALISSVVSSTLGTFAAIGLSRATFPGARLLSALFLSPLVVPGVVLGFALVVFFSLTGLDSSFARIVLAHVLVTIPYTIRTSLAVVDGISATLTEAALSLGANERQALLRVVFPLARTGIATGFILAFAFSMDDISATIFLTDPKVYTLPVALASSIKSQFNLTIAAASIMLILLAIAFIVVLDRIVGIEAVLGKGIYRS